MAVLIGRTWNKRCRLIKDFDREMKEEEPRKTPETNKLLNEKKQALIKELNSYVALRKTYTSSLGNKQELLDGGSFGGPAQNDNVRMASTMSNQELVQTGRKQMDETDQTIERSKKVCEPICTSSSFLVRKVNMRI
jgi:SNARE protein